MSKLCSAFALALAGCVAPPVEAPITTVEQETRISSVGKRDQVDLLFMIDDSGSMKPKQEQLKARFGDLIKTLDSLAVDQDKKASYHIGVITSSMGAPGAPSNVSSGCVSYGGRLQAVGKGAEAGCQPPVGKNYIEYDQRGAIPPNFPPGQTLEDTFTCMASVGNKGCGFEMPLESAFHALTENLAENAGFLRKDASLAIVFLTDEDDCSIEPSSDLLSSTTRGPLNSFRCTRYGIKCDGQFPLPDAPQPSFASCTPATPADGSPLTDLQKYVKLFTKPRMQGGIKDDPGQVVLAAIRAPEVPFGTTVGDAANCGGSAGCTVLAPSCVASFDPAFTGDPAVRLTSLINSVPKHHLANICGSDVEYKDALVAIGSLIVDSIGGCLTSPIAKRDDPECVVEDVTDDGRTSIPSCKASGGQKPCWELVDSMDKKCKPVCDQATGKYQNLSVAVDRAAPVPASTVTAISCLTIAIPNIDPNAACGPMP